MRRFRWPSLLLLLLLAGAVSRAAVRPFRFLQITDTHMSVAEAHRYRDKYLRGTIDAANVMVLRPDFLLHTGDITDLGSEDQFERYRADVTGAKMPIFTVPGNHEERWADAGITRYERHFGSGRVSFLHNGLRFIGFDATIPLRGEGIVTPENRRWIVAQLAKDPAGTPAILFCHQPPMYPRWVGMSGDDALFGAIAPYNVVAFLNGHGHGFVSWWVNGVYCHMTATMMSDACTIFDVGPESIGVYEVKNGEKTSVATVPLHPKRLTVTIRPLGEDRSDPSRQFFEADVEPSDAVPISRVECLVDAAQRRGSKDWSAIRPVSPGRYAFAVSTASLAPGRHTLCVRAVEGEDRIWTAEAPLNAGGSEVCRTWDSGSVLQAPAVADGGLVFAGAWDGHLYARDARTLAPRWTFAAGGRIVGSPAVDGGAVFVASTNGSVFALEEGTGKRLWTRRLEGPLQAHLLAADGVLYVGGAHAMHSLDARTGKDHWTLPLPMHVQARPVLADGTLCFGAWDSTFYGVDAATGEVRWKKTLGTSTAYSPAAASPVAGAGKVVCTVPTTAAEKDAPNVLCFDIRTGALAWGFRLPEGRFCEASPVTDGAKVYAASSNGDLFALNLADGRFLWTAHTGEGIADLARTVSDGAVVAVTASGSLSAYGTNEGERIWSRKDGDGFTYAWPVVSDHILYQTSLDGTLSAFSLPRG